MSYSPYFKTIIDNKEPTKFGRGLHLSILQHKKPSSDGFEYNDLVIVWDEDHDTRIIDVLNEMYEFNLLNSVRFIGERKGILNILTDYHDERLSIEKMDTIIGWSIKDSWDVNINPLWADDDCEEINDLAMWALTGGNSEAAQYLYHTGIAYDVFPAKFIDNK